MENYIIQIDDEEGGRGRKIYLTSWGWSVWKLHAKGYEKEEAEKVLNEYLKANVGETGRVIFYEA